MARTSNKHRNTQEDEDEVMEEREEDEEEEAEETPKKSNKRRRPKKSNADGTDEDAEDEPAAKGKKRAAKPKQAALSQEQLKAKGAELARFLVCSELNRKPVTRLEIGKKLDGVSRNFGVILEHAQVFLNQNMGLEIVEVRAKGHGIGQVTKKKKKRAEDGGESADEGQAGKKKKKYEFTPGKAYILRSRLSANVRKKIALADEIVVDEPTGQRCLIDLDKSDQMPHLGILYVVLSLVMVSGRSIQDDILKGYLKKLDLKSANDISINPGTAPSVAATKLTVEKILDSFVKQSYLEKVVINPDLAKGRNQRNQADLNNLDAATGINLQIGDTNIDWRWGSRAEAEIGETSISRFIEEFYLEEDADQNRKDILHKLYEKNMDRAVGGELQDVTAPA